VRRVTAKGMIALADRLLDPAIELGDWKMAANNAQLRRSVSSSRHAGAADLAAERSAYIREGSRKMTMRPM
jgi:hypothetical protein